MLCLQASSVYLASRTDIGYSLGTGGNFPNTYWEKCSTVHDMFETLLEPFPPERNPLHIMYDGLHALGARKKTVVTAYEERGKFLHFKCKIHHFKRKIHHIKYKIHDYYQVNTARRLYARTCPTMISDCNIVYSK